MQTERRVAANPQTKPTDLGCESAERLKDERVTDDSTNFPGAFFGIRAIL